MCLLTKSMILQKYYIFKVVFVSYRLSVSKNVLTFYVYYFVNVIPMHDKEQTMHWCLSMEETLILLSRFRHCLEPMYLIGRILLIAQLSECMSQPLMSPLFFWFIVTWLNLLVNFKQKWLTTYVTFHKESVRDSLSLYTHVMNIPIACMCVAKFQKSCTSTVFSAWKIIHSFTTCIKIL